MNIRVKCNGTSECGTPCDHKKPHFEKDNCKENCGISENHCVNYVKDVRKAKLSKIGIK